MTSIEQMKSTYTLQQLVAAFPGAAAELTTLLQRCEKAETAIAWANNSLYGSHNFFLSTNGGEPDEHHLDRPIEELKRQANSNWTEREGQEMTEIDKLKDLIDDFVTAEVDNAIAYVDGGAPSDRKEAELREKWRKANEALIAALSALHAKAGVSVKVKELEWGETSYGRPEVYTQVGVYRINEAWSGGWSVTIGKDLLRDTDGRANFPTIEAAKAAAQADYDARILSALEVNQ